MYLNYIALSTLFILCFFNLVILFFLAAFLVRFRIDLLALIERLTPPPQQDQLPVPTLEKSKTWDQKYEDELEFISNRIRQNAVNGDL